MRRMDREHESQKNTSPAQNQMPPEYAVFPAMQYAEKNVLRIVKFESGERG